MFRWTHLFVILLLATASCRRQESASNVSDKSPAASTVSTEPVTPQTSPTANTSSNQQLAATENAPATPPPTAAAADPDLIKKGQLAYRSHCIACHHMNPKKSGPLGPDIAGSSLELLELRILKVSYPTGYKPKRNTKAMKPLPQIKALIPALHAYLNSL